METRFFERPEGVLAYEDSGGGGELVVMMPGMGALRSEYRFLAPADFDDYMGALMANLHEAGRFEALKGLGFSPKTASEERVTQVRAPGLVVMGTKDPDWPEPAAEAHWIAEALSAELLLVEGAGHYPQTEMPEKVAPAIVGFLSRVGQNEG